MARISYTVYKTSVLATILSFISGMLVMAGCAFAAVAIVSSEYSMIPMGIFFFALGIGGKFLAEILATNAWWRQAIKAQNLEPEISNSVDFCFKVYNANSNSYVLKKIEQLNPQGAAQIRSALSAQQK